jgi:predicted nucleic acid-binding protein
VSLVIDASMTVAWLFHNQRSDHSRSILRRVVADGAAAPSIWRLEVANVLRTSVRRGHCRDEYAAGCLQRLRRLRITIDPETDRNAWGITRELSRAHNLTLYDAAYLELAVRLRQPIASLDVALLSAARTAGLEAVGD